MLHGALGYFGVLFSQVNIYIVSGNWYYVRFKGCLSHLWPWQIGTIFPAIKEKTLNCIFKTENETPADESDTKMLHFNFTANGLFSFYCAHWARCRPLLFYCVILHLILLFLQGKTKHLDNWIKLSSKEKDHVLQSGAETSLFSFPFLSLAIGMKLISLHCLLPMTKQYWEL